jgi:hypothetical protein
MTPDDATALLQTIDREGLVLSARNLNAVYHEMVSHGRIARPEAQPATVQYQDIPLRQSRGAGAPRATGGGAEPPRGGKTEQDYEKMSYDEIQKEARKMGLI